MPGRKLQCDRKTISKYSKMIAYFRAAIDMRRIVAVIPTALPYDLPVLTD